MTDTARPSAPFSGPTGGDAAALAGLAHAVGMSLVDLADLTRPHIDLDAIRRRLWIALTRLPGSLASSTPAAAVRTVCSYAAAGSILDTYLALLTAQDTMPRPVRRSPRHGDPRSTPPGTGAPRPTDP